MPRRWAPTSRSTTASRTSSRRCATRPTAAGADVILDNMGAKYLGPQRRRAGHRGAAGHHRHAGRHQGRARHRDAAAQARRGHRHGAAVAAGRRRRPRSARRSSSTSGRWSASGDVKPIVARPVPARPRPPAAHTRGRGGRQHRQDPAHDRSIGWTRMTSSRDPTHPAVRHDPAATRARPPGRRSSDPNGMAVERPAGTAVAGGADEDGEEQRAPRHRPGGAAGEGDADRQHDPPAARRGEGGPARRGVPRPARRRSTTPRSTSSSPAWPPSWSTSSSGCRRRSRPARPSEPELRIAQAQLVGWLEGLFHGIQTAIYAQQMAARAQLEQMRRALPPGAACRRWSSPGEGDPDPAGQPERRSGGLYL